MFQQNNKLELNDDKMDFKYHWMTVEQQPKCYSLLSKISKKSSNNSGIKLFSSKNYGGQINTKSNIPVEGDIIRYGRVLLQGSKIHKRL